MTTKQAKQIIEATANKDKTPAGVTAAATTAQAAPLPANTPAAPSPAADGFDTPDEGGSGSIIRGVKLKFNDAEWLDRDDAVIDPAREFIVAEIKRVVQKWLPGESRPETRELGPDEFFPNIEKMNEEEPQSEWREAFGKREGPYQKAYVAYLFDPRTMGAFTFVTATVGGRIAVEDLKGKVKRARMLQGANMFARVTLGATHMNTKFGGRERPDFKVLDYVSLGGPAKPLLEPAKPRPTLAEELNDALPENL